MGRQWLILVLWLIFASSSPALAGGGAGHFFARCGIAFEHLLSRLPGITGEQPAQPREWPGHYAGRPRPVSTSEGTLERDFKDRILPHFLRHGKRGRFTGAGGLTIRYRVFEVPDEKGAVVISHGRGQTLASYMELIHNLAEQGYSVYLLEHRGHGGSGRFVSNPRKVHVDRFDNYVSDLETFMNTVVGAKEHPRTVLLGHSMGGLVATLYAHRNPDKIDRLVLSAPMLRMNLKGIPETVARGILRVVRLIGAEERYAFGEKDEPAGRDRQSPREARRRFIRQLERHPLFGRGGMGGSTFGWVAESLMATHVGQAVAREMKVPTLLVQAGRDTMVDNGTQDRFCAGHPNCYLLRLPEARHGIFEEKDGVRDRALHAIFDFMGAETVR